MELYYLHMRIIKPWPTYEVAELISLIGDLPLPFTIRHMTNLFAVHEVDPVLY